MEIIKPYDLKKAVPKIDLAASESNDDWIRARRLLLKAKAGDEEARRELELMDAAYMYTRDEDEKETQQTK
jgi:hypothetical protein